MDSRIVKIAACALWFFAVGLAPVVGADGSARAQASEEMDPEAALQAYVEMMRPAQEHEALQVFVGSWDVAVKSWWQGPDGPAGDASGISEIQWILDGHYLEEKVVGEASGMPFQGLGIMGYDKFRGEHFFFWVDNMSTGMAASRGAYDADAKTYTFTGTMDDPMTGRRDVPTRSVVKIESADRHFHEAFQQTDGEWVKTMELVYTRRK